MAANSGSRRKRTKCDECGRMMATSITTCHGCGKTLCTRGYADAPGKHEHSCRDGHRAYSPGAERLNPDLTSAAHMRYDHWHQPGTGLG